ncbi:hypothetical protein PHLGIDRAFT_107529 [Phlebiopsis gigantea 11061_1 CR5-6]|uniref:N(6)-L-threonylcarbamoyladenine synthase n=1 Tax=Phlebiopsis gigantea (strain 11061_1 CR5-6) TaxID=745531 RepID=A0A0C3S672_PHLG1|nr:hypothetical protein PHLGIDRAFT_107529 [Phlebiopsis gigantea 11061_1 CR5-6]
MLLALRRCSRTTRLPSLCPWVSRKFTVLALESSADDTCAAVVTSDRQIMSNVVIKQLHRHEVYGGIEPIVAMSEHQKNMPSAIRQALDQAKLEVTDVDGIAFTRGPGMPGCLSVCLNAAKNLACALRKPLIGVHHMQAHALTAILTARSAEEMPIFPFLTLLISGGHTLIVLVLGPQSFRILASTVDEAVGAVIDAAARSVRVKWDGLAPGAALEALARDGLADVHEQDIPAIPRPNLPFPGELKFSFAGLHSWVDRYVLTHDPNTRKRHKTLYLSNPHRVAVARVFQDAAFRMLEDKVVLALKHCDPDTVPIQHVVVSGGVGSNLTFRARLRSALRSAFPDRDIKLICPPPELCTDNAAMIGWASMHRFLAGESDDYAIRHIKKWSIEQLDDLVA